MRIEPTDTIANIATKNAALFHLGLHRIGEQVKALEVPAYIPLMRPNEEPRNIECRDVLATITMRELDAVSDIEITEEYLLTVLSTMLKLEREDIPHLQFLGALRYFIEVVETLDIIGKMWKKIEIPDESGYTPPHPDRGLLAVVQAYAKGMGGAVKFPDEAWDALLLEVYRFYEDARDEYMRNKAWLAKQRKNN